MVVWGWVLHEYESHKCDCDMTSSMWYAIMYKLECDDKARHNLPF